MPSAKNPEDQRIAKLLARAGVASRREVERMIAEGRVALNGVVLDTPATILASLDGVTVDGNPVEAPSAARLFIYHKPSGLLVTERDPGGRPTIYDRLPKTLPRVVPVGRLDLNTEGLLLLTTDGGLKRQLELPATGVERAYRARAYGNVTQAQLEDLIEGVEIEGVRYGSIDANIERRTGANVWIEMILTEGKNREVRRVLEHLGLKVSRLIRTRYGPFVLGDLPPGTVGEVRPHDVESFRGNPTRKDLPQPARSRDAGLKPVEPRAAPKPPPRDAKPKREPERPTTETRPRRPARPGKPVKAPRQRADGSLAVKAGSTARSSRARNFRQERGDAPPSAAPSGGTRPTKGPAGGRGKPSGRPPRKRT
jgi:23S rRNA pseudouridine2605 synthase